MPRRTDQSIKPMESDDFRRFLNAPTIVNDHHRRGVAGDHTGPQGEGCQQCDVMAFNALVPLGARARSGGWTRFEALDYLDDHPVAVDTLVKDGAQKTRTDAGALAAPTKAAHNVAYQEALTQARERGDLAVTVATATEVLGWVIRSVQDQTAVVESGEICSWTHLQEQLHWEERVRQGGIPNGVHAKTVWLQIEVACERHPRAARMLDDHVYRHSANSSQHTLASEETGEGPTTDPIDNLAEDRSLTTSGHEGRSHDTIVLQVHTRIAKTANPPRELVIDTTRRVLRDLHGLEDTHTDAVNDYCELVADDIETLLDRNDPPLTSRQQRP